MHHILNILLIVNIESTFFTSIFLYTEKKVFVKKRFGVKQDFWRKVKLGQKSRSKVEFDRSKVGGSKYRKGRRY